MRFADAKLLLDASSRSLESERTLYPYVTGTSVVAFKYRDGILMAADMGGSYGSTLRYKTVERIKPIGKHSLLGASGEISDFQEILRYLDELILYDNMWDDGNSLGPKEVHNYLTRVMYNRRNKFNPLWNSLVLGGVKNGQKYLGMVSMIGVNFEDNHVATGFGNHLARPILRDEWNENLSFEDGVKLLEKCMRVLLYRDRSAVNKLQIAKITEEGATIFPPYSLKTFWGFEAFKNPTIGAEGMKYEVFLSFRGSDTRDNFTSCLYSDMVEKGIRVFQDNEELRVGEEIGGNLLQALDDTQIYIPIFSKGFASSPWCLSEIAYMVDCTSKLDRKKVIFPVFFDVKPDDVKLRTELYRDALSEHEKNYGTDKVNRWREALLKVASIEGWVLEGKAHGEVIKLIVREVLLKLKGKNSRVIGEGEDAEGPTASPM